MKQAILFALISLAIVNCYAKPPVVNGGFVGTGGDVIECIPSTDNFLNGLYSLDYVATLEDIQKDPKVIADPSLQKSLERIEQLLSQKVPSLAASFRTFREDFLNTRPQRNHVWEPAPFGLINIQDEKLTSQVPPNCQKQGGPAISQAVIKESQGFSGTLGTTVIYKYDSSIFNRLMQESPVQLSFLLVHEWLWEMSSNVDRNRRLNRFFHSPEFAAMSAEDVAKYLNALGFYPPGAPSSIFDKGICAGNPLTPQDLSARYLTQVYVVAHKGQFDSRSRIEECVSPLSDCDKSWHSLSFSPLLNSESRLLVEYARKTPQNPFGLQIFVKEDYGTRLLLTCDLLAETEQNLRCVIEDSTALFPVAGAVHDKFLRGFANLDCVRIEYFASYESDVIGVESGTEKDLLQNVLYFK